MDFSSNIPAFFQCHGENDDGPPIAVEWAYASIDHAEIVSAAHLVRSPPEWCAQISGDELATHHRGVSLSDLKSYGEEPAWIAERMNSAFRDRELFSVAPQDAKSLRQLFDAADVQPEFELRQVVAETLIADLARLKRLPKSAFARLKRKAQLRTPNCWPAAAQTQAHALLWAQIATPA